MSSSSNRDPWWSLSKQARGTLMCVAGIGLVSFVVISEARPPEAVLLLLGAMLGLPVAFSWDRRDRGGSSDDTPESPG